MIYNGVNKKFNAEYSLEQINDFKRKHFLPNNFILFLGNTAPKKNTPTFIEAYADYCELSDEIIPLVVLDYKKELVEVILDVIGKKDVINSIFFPGFISSDQMPLIYNAAMLFVYPSLRESFGLPILEAMGCKTPVITSNTSCMPEIAGNAAFLVNPKSAKEIAEAIKIVVDNKTLREDLRIKGIERVSSFSWESSARQLLVLYNKFNY